MIENHNLPKIGDLIEANKQLMSRLSEKEPEAAVPASKEFLNVGMLSVATANDSVSNAISRAMPRDLWEGRGMIYENEVTCIFGDTNVGKSIFAVQVGVDIARNGHTVLYLDCELSDRQFAKRYINEAGDQHFTFPPNFYRAEIGNMGTIENYGEDFENSILESIKSAVCQTGATVVIVDNLTWLCSQSEHADSAGRLMTNLVALKRDHDLTVIVVGHTPKRDPSNPVTMNDLAGSKRLVNFFDSVIAVARQNGEQKFCYVKHLKGRNDMIVYDSTNVLAYKIEKEYDGFLGFSLTTTAPKGQFLKIDRDRGSLKEEVESYLNVNYSAEKIAGILGLSRATVYRLIKDIRKKN